MIIFGKIINRNKFGYANICPEILNKTELIKGQIYLCPVIYLGNNEAKVYYPPKEYKLHCINVGEKLQLGEKYELGE
jgi:hypothetical protein